ncbi:MAG: hypothetical protein OXC44_00345 [Proteobacteria bacterium]|nr:hypothetical protein [Pseudomonadota bacterium]
MEWMLSSPCFAVLGEATSSVAPSFAALKPASMAGVTPKTCGGGEC